MSKENESRLKRWKETRKETLLEYWPSYSKEKVQVLEMVVLINQALLESDYLNKETLIDVDAKAIRELKYGQYIEQKVSYAGRKIDTTILANGSGQYGTYMADFKDEKLTLTFNLCPISDYELKKAAEDLAAGQSGRLEYAMIEKLVEDVADGFYDDLMIDDSNRENALKVLLLVDEIISAAVLSKMLKNKQVSKEEVYESYLILNDEYDEDVYGFLTGDIFDSTYTSFSRQEIYYGLIAGGALYDLKERRNTFFKDFEVFQHLFDFIEEVEERTS